MFAVIDEACSSRTYNELPDVVDADAALKPLGTELKEAITRASQVCRDNSFPPEALGGFLLHKHWDIDKEQSMIELPGLHPSGRRALCTSARPSTLLRSAAPSRFKVGQHRRELVALEFSVDPLVRETWRSLKARPDVIQALCEVIASSGLADKIGLGIVSRDLPLANGEAMVEENFNDQSLLSARSTPSDDDATVIQTGWSFVIAGDGGEPVCVSYCFQVGNEPHSRSHYATHPE
jgi:hypothetical protein